MTALGYIRRMAVIGESTQEQIKVLLLEASKDPDVPVYDLEALVYSARKVFFPNVLDFRRP